MFIKNSLLVAKVSFALLTIATIILAVKLYNSDNEIEKIALNLELDKKVHNNEMSEILIRYDSVLVKNKKLSKKMESIEKQSNLDSELSYDDSIKLLKGNISILKKGNLSKEKQLANLNSILKSKQLDLENNKEEIISLNLKIGKLQAEIKNSFSEVSVKKLRAINVSAIGSKIVSEKILETKKLNRTEKIKVCFTLEDNPAIENGTKDIFIQIINPKSNIVSNNHSVVEIKNKTLFYSAKTTVSYGKEDVDVCVFVDANKDNLIKGNYIVNIFSGASLIGNTNLTLL